MLFRDIIDDIMEIYEKQYEGEYSTNGMEIALPKIGLICLE